MWKSDYGAYRIRGNRSRLLARKHFYSPNEVRNVRQPKSNLILFYTHFFDYKCANAIWNSKKKTKNERISANLVRFIVIVIMQKEVTTKQSVANDICVSRFIFEEEKKNTKQNVELHWFNKQSNCKNVQNNSEEMWHSKAFQLDDIKDQRRNTLWQWLIAS